MGGSNDRLPPEPIFTRSLLNVSKDVTGGSSGASSHFKLRRSLSANLPQLDPASGSYVESSSPVMNWSTNFLSEAISPSLEIPGSLSAKAWIIWPQHSSASCCMNPLRSASANCGNTLRKTWTLQVRIDLPPRRWQRTYINEGKWRDWLAWLFQIVKQTAHWHHQICLSICTNRQGHSAALVSNSKSSMLDGTTNFLITVWSSGMARKHCNVSFI